MCNARPATGCAVRSAIEWDFAIGGWFRKAWPRLSRTRPATCAAWRAFCDPTPAVTSGSAIPDRTGRTYAKPLGGCANISAAAEVSTQRRLDDLSYLIRPHESVDPLADYASTNMIRVFIASARMMSVAACDPELPPLEMNLAEVVGRCQGHDDFMKCPA